MKEPTATIPAKHDQRESDLNPHDLNLPTRGSVALRPLFLSVAARQSGVGSEAVVAALTCAHLLMTIAKMIGNHPNFRIFMTGGFCLTMRTHKGIRAVKTIQTSGVRYRLSGKRKREKVRARAHEHGLQGHGLGYNDERWAWS